MKKKFIVLYFIFSALSFVYAQEKGSVIIGVVSNNSQAVNFESIKTSIKNQFGANILKIEFCDTHSIIYLLLNTNAKPLLSFSDILNHLVLHFNNYTFFEKTVNEPVNNLNCKWK